MLSKIGLNKLILSGILTYFFVLFQMAAIGLISSLITVFGLFNFVVYQILFFTGYFILIYFVLNSRVFRVYLGIIFLLASGITLFLILFSAAIDQFFMFKIELGIILGLSVLINYYNFRFIFEKHPSLVIHSRNFKIALILIPLLSGSLLFLPIYSITIEPETKPELYFWTSAAGIPDNNDTLDFCAENNIGFVVALREHYIDDGGAEEYAEIQRALSRNVKIYINIGGPTGDVFFTLENAQKFCDIFDSIRDWLIDNNIYDDIEFFTVDAETPKQLVEDMAEYDLIQKAGYFISEIPTEADVKAAQKSIKELIEQIHDDDKKIGIVKVPSISDEQDGDNDYSQITRNIYMLDLDWDFSVSMIYRTQHLPDLFDYFLQDMSKYDYTSDDEIEYTEKSDLERYLMPKSTFYYKLSYEVYNTEVGVPQDARYAFIGTFSSKFKDTSYIQNKEYRQDVDMCRHLGMDKVFFYDYSGFRARYGSDELADLIDYIDKEQSWTLAIPIYYLQRELLTSILYATIDKFLYI